MASSHPINYLRYESDKWRDISAETIVETPVALTVNGEMWLTFMCTPTHIEPMAVGFLFNEGIISGMDEVADVRVCPHGDNVDVWTTHPVEKPKNWRRTSGCTGGQTAALDDKSITAVQADGWKVSPQKIGQLIEMLFDSQSLYKETGGVHTSALSDGEQVLVSSEDIGRHNTLDKLAGLWLIQHREKPAAPLVIITTGRISSEMLQKAARMGAGMLVSRTSPSSLSIEMAGRLGVTLIGYARRHRFNVYTHPERIERNSQVTGAAVLT